MADNDAGIVWYEVSVADAKNGSKGLQSNAISFRLIGKVPAVGINLQVSFIRP